MIPFEEIDSRLEAIGKNRAWLASNTPYSTDYIRTVLAPNSTRRTERVMAIISGAIEAEEQRLDAAKVEESSTPPGYSKIFLSDEEVDLADEASRLVAAPSLAAFCHDVIQGEARRIIAEHAKRLAAVEAADVIRFPFVIIRRGSVAAGGKSSADVEEEEMPSSKKYPSNHYALRVLGQSMEPTIPDGSLIVVKAFKDQGFPRKGSIVVYNDGYGSTLKVFDYEKAEGDEEHARMNKVPVLKSINPDYPDVEPLEGGRIDAVFVEILE